MSGFEVLNIFGRLTNINRTKVDFVQADVNNDGQVTQEEFRNIESMCNIDSDKITFGGVDKNGDGVIVESEWKTIQVGMDMQSVLNQIQGAISRELCGVDSVLQEELAEYLAQRTNDWATIVNMNLDNAKDVFKTYIEGEMQNWLTANNSRRPSVIIQTVAAELLNGDPDAGVAGYLDSATQSDYHQRLITEAINSFARGWMECYYANYDNATDLADALRAAVQAYMSKVTNEQNGTTRLDDIQSQAIAHEQAIADASVNTIVRQINDITNANPQDFVNRIDTAITYLQSLDLNGDTEAEAYLNYLINGLNNARGICSQILTDMNTKLALAQQEQQAAANAATSKEAAQHAAEASQYQSDADELFATFNQTKLKINNLLNDVHTIEQGIANGTTTGGTTTGGTTNENNNSALAEGIDNALGNYQVSTSVPNNSTGTVNSETALRNAAKQVIDNFLDQMKDTLLHSNLGLSSAIVNTAVTNVKNYYHNILDGDMSRFVECYDNDEQLSYNLMTVGIYDYEPYVNSSNPGQMLLNITAVAHKLRDEIIRLSGAQEPDRNYTVNDFPEESSFHVIGASSFLRSGWINTGSNTSAMAVEQGFLNKAIEVAESAGYAHEDCVKAAKTIFNMLRAIYNTAINNLPGGSSGLGVAENVVYYNEFTGQNEVMEQTTYGYWNDVHSLGVIAQAPQNANNYPRDSYNYCWSDCGLTICPNDQNGYKIMINYEVVVGMFFDLLNSLPQYS